MSRIPDPPWKGVEQPDAGGTPGAARPVPYRGRPCLACGATHFPPKIPNPPRLCPLCRAETEARARAQETEPDAER